jgi:hypothetical protein
LNALAGVVSLCPTVTGEVFSVKEGNSAMTRVGAGGDAEAGVWKWRGPDVRAA